MKKIFFLVLFGFFSFWVLAQNADSSYVGVDTTLASYQLGRKIGEWFPFVMLVIIVLLYIRGAYRHGDQKHKIEE
ncbi:MAG TPA: hypothetical protein ENK85_10000 [Saprospiraceae bacterium]|nr:hypothetical protein [Saprospiraceae bacterium]